MRKVHRALFKNPPWVVAVLALSALIALGWAGGLFEPQPVAADDATYYLDCPTTEVREGENVDVFLVRVTNHKHTTKYWANWYTDAGTADETDYVHQSSGQVWTTDAEAAADRDRRVFRTRSDNQLEEDETFTARFGPDDDIVDLNDPDWDNKCEITILDDDPNIRRVEVTSEPARESNTYGVGEVIEISATFSNRVEVAEGGNPRLGLRVGDDWKQAQYLRGSDSRVLVFGYTVKADDVDTDGIRMPGGYQDSEDRWHNFPGYDAITHHSSDRVVYRAYKGFDDDENHKVDGSLAPLATNVEITSSPETGDTYRFGETVEVSMTFNTALDVEGSRYINLWSGPDGDTVWRAGTYNRGSGTNTLVFAYDVRSRDLDPDGITTEGTSTFEMDLGIADEPTGLGGDGTITIAGTDTEVYPRFSGLYDSQSGHKLDGRPYPKEMSISSRPVADTYTYGRDENIEVSVDFGQPVTAGDLAHVILGLDTDLNEKLAEYASGNGTNVLVFRYSVDERDSDDDGISVDLPDNLEITATNKDDVAYDHNPVGAINSLDEDIKHKVDGSLLDGDETPPTVRAVTFSGGPANSDDVYVFGEMIVVQAHFDETVVVLGEVRIDLDIGGKVRQAVHPNPAVPTDPGGLTIGQRLRFYYQVQEGDEDDDGVSIIASSLMLDEATIEGGVTIADGATIADEAGNPALLAHHGIPDHPEHLVSAPDDTAPTISSVRIVSDPGDDDTYGEGDVVLAVAFFSEDVIVTGTPQLELDFDGTAKTADYVSTFGTEVADPSELKFTYTVALNDSDANGIAIGNNALILNGGTIQDESENDADLTLKSIPSQSGHMVDASDNTPPTVSSIAITSDPGDDDTYGPGDAIEVTVTFNEDVTVTGTPQLELDFDGTARTADFSHTGGPFDSNRTTQSNTDIYDSTVVFSYTVAPDESDTDGIAIGADKLTLNGGTIQDAAGNAATLTHDALAANSGHKVDGSDTVAPTISSIAVTSDPGDDDTYSTGDTIQVTVTFSEDVTVTGEPQLELEFADPGSSNQQASYSSSNSGGARVVFEYTVAVGDSASDGLAIAANKLTLNGGSIQDASGNDAVLTHSAYGPDADHFVNGHGGV